MSSPHHDHRGSGCAFFSSARPRFPPLSHNSHYPLVCAVVTFVLPHFPLCILIWASGRFPVGEPIATTAQTRLLAFNHRQFLASRFHIRLCGLVIQLPFLLSLLSRVAMTCQPAIQDPLSFPTGCRPRDPHSSPLHCPPSGASLWSFRREAGPSYMGTFFPFGTPLPKAHPPTLVLCLASSFRLRICRAFVHIPVPLVVPPCPAFLASDHSTRFPSFATIVYAWVCSAVPSSPRSVLY